MITSPLHLTARARAPRQTVVTPREIRIGAHGALEALDAIETFEATREIQLTRVVGPPRKRCEVRLQGLDALQFGARDLVQQTSRRDPRRRDRKSVIERSPRARFAIDRVRPQLSLRANECFGRGRRQRLDAADRPRTTSGHSDEDGQEDQARSKKTR